MKKNQRIMILILMTAGLTVSAVAETIGSAPAVVNTPVPAESAAVATPVSHHHHHHQTPTQTGTSVNTVVATPSAGTINVAPMSTPQPLAVPSIH